MGFDAAISTAVDRNAPSVTTDDTLLKVMQIMVDQRVSALVLMGKAGFRHLVVVGEGDTPPGRGV